MHRKLAKTNSRVSQIVHLISSLELCLKKIDSPFFHIAYKKGHFDVVELILNSSKSPRENGARGNRKTLKCLKTITKSNFRTLKLKSHEEYLIYRTYFIK